MREIKIIEMIEKYIDDIKRIKNEKYPDDLTPTILKDRCRPFDEMILTFEALGINIVSQDVKSIKISVPKSSELFYIKDDKVINILGFEAARLFKTKLSEILSICTGEDAVDIFDTFAMMYREHDDMITYDNFISNMNKSNNTINILKDIQTCDIDHKEKLVMAVERFSTVQQFGIEFDSNSLFGLLQSGDTNTVIDLKFNVPQKSKYKYKGEELSGKHAYLYALETLSEVIPIPKNVNVGYNIVPGLIWDTHNFDATTARLNSSIDFIKKLIK